MTDSAARAVDPAVAWHGLTPEAALERQKVDPAAGLTSAEAESAAPSTARQVRGGAPRSLAGRRSFASTRTRCRSSCSAAGILSLFIPNQVATGVVLIRLTLLNAAMGLNQEGKANASVAALQKMMVVKAKTRRDGDLVELAMDQLVPGDIVNIEAGDLVPADGRILTAATLESTSRR